MSLKELGKHTTNHAIQHAHTKQQRLCIAAHMLRGDGAVVGQVHGGARVQGKSAVGRARLHLPHEAAVAFARERDVVNERNAVIELCVSGWKGLYIGKGMEEGRK